MPRYKKQNTPDLRPNMSCMIALLFFGEESAGPAGARSLPANSRNRTRETNRYQLPFRRLRLEAVSRSSPWAEPRASHPWGLKRRALGHILL